MGRKLTKSVIVAPGIRKSSARHCPDYSNNSEIRRNKEKQSLKKLLQLTKPISKEIMMDGICLPKSYCISSLCRKKTPQVKVKIFYTEIRYSFVTHKTSTLEQMLVLTSPMTVMLVP